ncbi:MAG: TonB-dependent receptor, partial [Bryobacteraceae bacterium]
VGTTTAVTSLLGTSTAEDPQGRTSPVYEFRDRITWLHGRHTFKSGLDRRYTSANSYVSFDAVPRVTLGVAASTGTQNINTISGIGANGTAAGNLLALLAGSVASQNQYFFATAGNNPVYLPGQNAQHTWKEREWGTFFQDDFKARSNLTLSFGLRWDYYGTPFAANGNMGGIVGGSSNIFGISGSTLGALFNPGVYNINNLTQLEYIGKNSPNPSVNPWNNNNKNFAPTIGLSWSLPWLGKDKTVFRAGYGIAYERNTLVLVDQIFGYSAPGYENAVAYAPPSYQNLVNSTLPLHPTSAPFATVPINDTNSSTQTILTANSGLKTPYVQNWNTSIGRQLSKGFTLDLRYVGSKGTKLYRGSNINENNIFESGILNAFEVTDAGGNAPLFNQIFKGLNISGVGVVDGVNITGSQAVRQNTTLNAYLLTNNVGGFANFIAYNTFVTGIRGGLLKNGGLPPNLIAANPQFGSAYYISNDSNSTYNSGQVELNKRFSNGFQLQTAYVRSKALGDYDGTSQSETAAYETDRNHHLDKRLLSYDRPNVITSSAIFDVPLGPGKKYLSSTHGPMARVVERWQTAVIFDKYSGTPTTFTDSAGYTFNNTTVAEAAANGPLPAGSVHIVGNNVEYFNNLTQVTDPSAKSLPSSLQSQSALFAVQNASGQTILQNPALGTLGGLSPTAYRGLGTFLFNAQLSKSILISKEHNFTLKFRADAINLLNHPIWTTPSLNIDSTSFGLITAATGNRTFNLSVRLEF